MNLIVNLNPAIDRYLAFPFLRLGEVHRANRVHVQAGGKGVNVARALNRMLVPVELFLIVGGTSGKELITLLRNEGIPSQCFTTPSPTRTCTIGYDEATGKETVWNEPGSDPGSAVWPALLRGIKRRLDACATVTISGSVPPGTPADFPETLTRLARQAGCKVLLDTTAPGLPACLEQHPFLVKLNQPEVSTLLGTTPRTIRDLARAAQELVRRGAQQALVTAGERGAVFAGHGTPVHIQGPRISTKRRIHTTGAGDLALAGFLAGLEQGMTDHEAAHNAVAWGTAFAQHGPACSPNDIEAMVQAVTVAKI